MTTTKTGRRLAAVAAAGALLAACGSTKTATTGGSTATPASAASAAAPVSGQPGVSGHTITVATVSDNSGPIAGAFKGALIGAQAYAAYVNANGGVDGYRLKVVSDDSQTTCQGATTAAQQAVGSAFALVGGISLADECEVSTLTAHPQTPFIASALSTQVEALPDYYSISPSKPGTPLGPYSYMASTKPDAVKHTAVLYGTTPGAVTQQGYFNAAMKTAGYHIVYNRGVDPTVTDFTADIVRMRSAGVQYLFLDMFGQQIAEVMDQAAQQGWHPQVIQSVDSYEKQWFTTTTTPGANKGLVEFMYSSLYLGEDAKSVPEVATLDTWVNKVSSGFPVDTYAADAWGDMALFVHALKQAGTPTQAGVLKALGATTSFDDNGLFAPAGISAKSPATCYVIVQADADDTWSRLAPSKGYQCSPGGFQAPSAS